MSGTNELKEIYSSRKKKLSSFMKDNDIGCAVFIDSEEKREPAIRYFSGHINDAVLLIFDDEYSVLVPWDEILSKKYAFADKIIPYTKYKNNSHKAIKFILTESEHFKNKKVYLPPTTSYPEFLKFVSELEGCDVFCREKSVHAFVEDIRMIKDSYEIECTKKAAQIGDAIIQKIEKSLKTKSLKTEIDVALLIEKECRSLGAEKTGFETLAAGPKRSWGIHCFPNYTSEEFLGDGLSILDFGVVYNGYTSDTTLTVAKGNLHPFQEKMIKLVNLAYEECLKLYKPGIPILDAAKKADDIFASAKLSMPHGLGHAIGLEIHEAPRVSTKVPTDKNFLPGMILTLEPGLYDEKFGGVRLENDVLITETGNEVITHSKIIRL
ncbi:MAG: aminopeptidase P family protein [Treponema sp.]|nr:aminopeptidase P family protein [Treponema sp.]